LAFAGIQHSGLGRFADLRHCPGCQRTITRPITPPPKLLFSARCRQRLTRSRWRRSQPLASQAWGSSKQAGFEFFRVEKAMNPIKRAKPQWPVTIRPITLTIDPAPERAADEFKLTATSATECFSVDEPVIVGQYARNGGQSLTTMVRIYPSPPPHVQLVPWCLVKPTPTDFGRSVRLARERAGLSKAELARRTGLTEMTIRNIDNASCLPPRRAASCSKRSPQPASRSTIRHPSRRRRSLRSEYSSDRLTT
jgi:hypothetical protein